MVDTLNDSLADLIAGVDVAKAANPVTPANYQPRDFSEPCGKCGGSGVFRGYSGRTFGKCFTCKGAGKFTFKTSPQARANGRAAKADRKAEIATANAADFAAAEPVLSAWLIARADRGSSFAASLLEGVRRFGGLTGGQRDAVEKAIARDAAQAEVRASAPVADTAGVDRLKAAFDTAKAKAAEKGRGLRNPRITIGSMVISPAGATSKNPGALYVKAQGEYLGKIASGRFFAARECTPDQEKRVLAFVADPKAAAMAYGQETGVCCICNATLTNQTSIEAGIGPICASNFGW